MKHSVYLPLICWLLLSSVAAHAQTRVVVVPMGGNAQGDAVAADVRAGKTFSNKDDVGIAGTMVDNGAVQLNPGTADQAIPEGYHNGSGTVQGDAGLVPGNIRSGATIFGVAGTSVPASGTAIPGQVLAGQTFSNASGPATGSMPNVGAQNITPGTVAQTISQGYHNGTGAVAGDTDLVSGNIKSGTNIFGVSGDTNVVDTGSGDAVAGDLLSGKKAWVGGNEVTGSMTNVGAQNITPGTAAQTISQGYHNGSGSVAGDADLVSGNIKTGVILFGVTGDATPGVLGRTGQAVCYDPACTASPCTVVACAGTGQDGDWQRGVSVAPRFADNNDGTVTDNLTGLIWLKNANCTAFYTGDATGVNQRPWQQALASVNQLASGFCDLADDSAVGEWRLPNIRELISLVDFGQYSPALPSDHPFPAGFPGTFWSSTTATSSALTHQAWVLSFTGGSSSSQDKSTNWRVLAVRGGE